MSPTTVSSNCLNRVSGQPHKEGNKNRIQSSLWGEETDLRVWGSQETKIRRQRFRELYEESHTHAEGSLQIFNWVLVSTSMWGNFQGQGKGPRKGVDGTIPRPYTVLGNVLAFSPSLSRMEKPPNKLGIK